MEISEKKIDGVVFVSIENDVGMKVILCSLGASLFSINIKGKECLHHPNDEREFMWSNGYYGKTVGRIAGRIKNGVFSLDNKNYYLDKNENGNSLHSGSSCLGFKNFGYAINDNADNVEISFKYLSEEKEGGFPSNANVNIVYVISKKDLFFKNIHIVKLENKCPLSLTNHAYFNLGETSGSDLVLSFNPSKYAEMDNDLIIKSFNTMDTLFNFKSKKSLKEICEPIAKVQPKPNGIDHTFLFGKENKHEVLLRGKSLNLKLTTNYPAINIYANCYVKDVLFENNSDDKIYCAVALEPQNNVFDFESIIYGPNKEYYFTSEYLFEELTND